MDGARLTAVLVLLLCSALLRGEDRHLGVASCASAVCHGAQQAKSTRTVMQNERQTWFLHDRHARAYKTLLSDRSRAMANKLGLRNAHEAKECLDCHADNVPRGMRGRRFQISDGVGCEACHGGAERYLKPHTDPGVTHQDNLRNGLYPTEQPAARAELCLSCHLGNAEKLVTHEIMGAGHPRLSFELDTFTVLQPEHYKKDRDYIERKANFGSPQIWATGQLVAAKRLLTLVDSHWFKGSGLFPEISFFDCHACHHPMNQLRWAPVAGYAPGSIRFNDAYLQISSVIAEVLSPDSAPQWQQAVFNLHRAVRSGSDRVLAQSRELQNLLPGLQQRFAQPLSQAEQERLLTRLLQQASQGAFRDYSSAEQMVMGCNVLMLSLQLDKKLGTTLDRLYSSLNDENDFKPQSLVNAASAALKKVAGAL